MLRVALMMVMLVWGRPGRSDSGGEALQVDPDVPAPAAVLGFEPGARPATGEEILRYLERLAAATPRVRLREYARSHEGRPLVVLTISSTVNINNLERIQADLRRLGDPRSPAPAPAGKQLEALPAVIWLEYSIHGDEPSGADASLALAYRLAAGTDAATERLRDRLIVSIDPNQNPDGRARYLAQTTAFSKAVPDPDMEGLVHRGLWPWGRGNHYLFDLNRDWFAQVQPESRGRVQAVASWTPQLIVDAHEMESSDSFLFSPPRHPFNPHVPPEIRVWWERFAGDQARAFDARGWSYYTREWNEEFFPGYGTSWAANTGAVGVLYEQGATNGGVVRQRGGGLVTFAEAVAHQLTSSLANLQTAAEHKTALLTDWAAARRRAATRGADGGPRSFIILRGENPEPARRLVEALLTQGIEVLENEAAVEARNLMGYFDERPTRAALPSGSWLVPTAQPLGALVRNLFDVHVPMAEDFLGEEREWLERGQGSRLYDVTAWSVPLAFGVQAYWSAEIPGGDWRPVASVPPPAGQLENERGRYGFLLDGRSEKAMFVAASLLSEGVRMRVATDPFVFGGTSYERGALLVRRDENERADIQALLADLARRHGVTVQGVDGARANDGPDLGGNQFAPLAPLRIGVFAGDPIHPSVFGAVWHLLDVEMKVRSSNLDIGQLADIDLDRYTVLVLPPTYAEPEALRERLGAKGLARLREWANAGGTLIGIGTAAELLADADSGVLESRPRRQVLDRFPPVVLGLGRAEVAASGPLQARGVAAPAPSPVAGTDEKARGRSNEMTKPPLRWHDPKVYAVAPVVGPAARPFLPKDAATFALPDRLVSLDAWLGEELAAAGTDELKAQLRGAADARLRSFHPQGAYLRVELDPRHWVAYGAGKSIAALMDASEVFLGLGAAEVPGRFADLADLHLSGLLWPEAAGRIAHSAYALRESIGRGQAILFAANPLFRGYALATRRLFINAVVLGPGMGTRYPSPW